MFWVTITSNGVTPLFRHSITPTHTNHETRQLNTKRTVTAYTYKLFKRTYWPWTKRLWNISYFCMDLSRLLNVLHTLCTLLSCAVPKRDG